MRQRVSQPEFAQHEQRHNLPALPIPIIGRERHVAAVREALSRDDVRLFTLTGPPGTGKTRLALEVATTLVGEFRDGVYFVDLSSIGDHHLVAAAIAQELALREVDSQPLLERLQQALAERQMLLVLDNFEQLLGAAPDVAELLRACPLLKILITSQAGLRLHWEREYPVPPLELPDVQHLPSVEVLAEVPAVALFVSRAQAIQPQFRLTEANARSVAEVCVSLDGLPLAIELAASRTRTLSPETLLPRLQRRLETLQGGARDLRARHQTLRAAIGWSYSILEPAEQTLFRRLGVFAGGISLAAAAAVAGERAPQEGQDQLERLESLVGKSLLQSVPEPDDNPRFRMLETLREYALEQLAASGELEATNRRYAAYFLDLAEQAEAGSIGPDQKLWLERLAREHDNLRAALNWSVAHGAAETALRLGAALRWFWIAHGHLSEAERWVVSASLIGEQAPPAVLASALNAAGDLALVRGSSTTAHTLFEEGLILHRELGDRTGIAASLFNLGLVATDRGDLAAARGLFEESLHINQEIGDRWGTAMALHHLAVLARSEGDPRRAMALGTGAVRRFCELGDTVGMALCLINQGNVVSDAGDSAQAVSLIEEGLTQLQQLGDKRGTAFALLNLAVVAYVDGETRQAESLAKECLLQFRELGIRRHVATALELLGAIAACQDQPDRAARLFGAAGALRKAIQVALLPADRARVERDLAQVRTSLDKATFEAALAEGQMMPLDQAIDEALATGVPVAPLTPALTGAGVVDRPPALMSPVSGAAAPHGPHGAHNAAEHAAEHLDEDESPPAALETALTARERQLAMLIAQGRKNREIANELIITEQTAAVHVKHILRKLSLSSRAQIATWVVQHGLLGTVRNGQAGGADERAAGLKRFA